MMIKACLSIYVYAALDLNVLALAASYLGVHHIIQRPALRCETLITNLASCHNLRFFS